MVMKLRNFLFVALAAALLWGCRGGGDQQSGGYGDKHHPEWCLDDVIYELNTRQFTPEGTFAAAEGHLDRLRDLGVDIIWLMPIHPIGVEERKGELGSYYAISDYKAVNPEFGTMDDFRSFVAAAHARGMRVIMDWVANHTSPDALWSEHEDWYRLGEDGKFLVMYDWTDIAPLDYTNREMRAAMIDAMSFWLREADIDGFRCDVAHEVPVDFWDDATEVLRAIRPEIFMLAEAEKPELQNKAFDAYYGWELHGRMNRVRDGEQNADSLRAYFARHDKLFRRGFPMLFTSNHDENSWNGTEFERMGGAATMLAAMTYVLPGMPLIYNGQEVGFDRRLEFFVKDSIDWVGGEEFTALYRGLNRLRHSNRALWSDGAGGTMRWLADGEKHEVLSVVREKEGNVVIGIFNLSSQPVEVTVDDPVFSGAFTEFDPAGGTGGAVSVAKPQTITLEGWQYKIYSK